MHFFQLKCKIPAKLALLNFFQKESSTMPDNNDNKLDFPKISVKNWWQLREKFKNSIPNTVTPSYLSTALGGMTPESAKKNLLGPLKKLEIIDDDGKTTKYANMWRDDETYSKYCEEVRNKIYPEELLHAQSPPNPNRDAVEKWFSQKTGVGSAAAKMFAATYVLLCEATPLDGTQIKATKAKSPVNKSTKQPNVPTKEPSSGTNTNSTDESQNLTKKSSSINVIPSIHIDVQIHISPESSAEQIDQIFASMAKHLSKMSNERNE